MGGVVVGAGAAGGEAEASGGVLRVACVRNKENSGIRCEIGKKKRVVWSSGLRGREYGPMFGLRPMYKGMEAQ